MNISEAWGFHNGEVVEVRTRVGHYQGVVGTSEGGWEWHRVTIVAFTSDRGVTIKEPTGRTRVVHNPKTLRKFVVPSTPDDIARFLGEA